jgi:hypothetical protein
VGKFITELKWHAVTGENGEWDKQTIMLDADYIYKSDTGIEVVAEKGFICDGLSIPFGFKWAVRPLGKGLRAGVSHDKLYKNKTSSRGTCDSILSEALKDCGINCFTRGVMWTAVRSFGWLFYAFIATTLLMATGCATVIPYAIKSISYISTGVKAMVFLDEAIAEKREKEKDDSNTNR